MKKLLIVESPTKARTLSRFLSKDYSIEATRGHIKDLPKSKLGVEVDQNFAPDYSVVPKQKSTITTLRKAAKDADEIYLATDPDREGEAIALHAFEILQGKKEKDFNKKVKRIVFHEITQNAVEDAINNPREIDKDLVEAQIARRVLDRLVGYKLSPLLWKKVRIGLSAGRVQSIALRLIVEREREIEAFVPDEYWEIQSEVKKGSDDPFLISLVRINDKKAEINNKEKASEVVKDLEKSEYTVVSVTRKEVKKNPYPPFTTSTMSQASSRLFGWSAKKTMTVAQRLYEEGLITYHRTDSTTLSKESLNKVRKYIESELGKEYLPSSPKVYKTKSKSAQEAHEAIRPTNVKTMKSPLTGKFEKDADRLYSLIWKRFVASQMNPAIYDETRIDVEATSENSKNKYILRVSGQVMKFDGWRKIIPTSSEEKPDLPVVDEGDNLELIKVHSDQKFTQPPPRYNEASLIKTLEKLEIGRPSTYAPTISTIQERNYVEKNEGRFNPTSVGIAVNDFLVKNFSNIFDYSFTADMEQDLDEVAQGKQDWQKMMKDFYMPFEKKLGSVEKNAERVEIPVEKTGEKCPTCKKGDKVIRVGRFGKFYSCSRFPDCDYTDKYVEKIGMTCPECSKGEVIVKTTRRGRKFYGCSTYPKCKFASWKNPLVDSENKNAQESS